MKTIRWKKEEVLDIGYGFTAIITSETTLDGLVMKAYIYKGANSNQAILATSVLSKEYDTTYLYSLIFRVLMNREFCESFWDKSINGDEISLD